MSRTIFYFLFIVISYNLSAQHKRIVVLNEENNSMEFVKVIYNKTTVFTDEEGLFYINDYKGNESIRITSFGYDTLTLKILFLRQ